MLSYIFDTLNGSALNPGSIYQFKVIANNSVGPSLDSNIVSILAGKVPDAPINLATDAGITSQTQIGLTWDPVVSSP